jgi:hypothetical protein
MWLIQMVGKMLLLQKDMHFKQLVERKIHQVDLVMQFIHSLDQEHSLSLENLNQVEKF